MRAASRKELNQKSQRAFSENNISRSIRYYELCTPHSTLALAERWGVGMGMGRLMLQREKRQTKNLTQTAIRND